MPASRHDLRPAPTRAGRARRIAAALTALSASAALAGCGQDADPTAGPSSSDAPVTTHGDADLDGAPDDALARTASLTTEDDCGELLGWITDQAVQRVGPYGLETWYGYGTATGDMAMAAEGAPATTMAPSAADAATRVEDDSSGSAGSSSGTNVQEIGVDEPDVVKNDGRHIVSVVGGVLRVVDATAADPSVIGSVTLDGWGHQLLVDGDRALVLSTGDTTIGALEASAASEAPGVPGGGGPTTLLTEIDLSDPAAPSVGGERLVDGWLVSARMVDGTARIVVQSTPTGPGMTYPDDVASEAGAAAENRRTVRDSALDDWVPRVYEPNGLGGWTSDPVDDCASIAHPTEYAGLGSVTVLTTEVGGPLDDLAPVTVVGDASQVYASQDVLTVAATRWPEVDPMAEQWEGPLVGSGDVATDLHQFSIAGDGPATYLASGAVDGTLLNQFSMSEHEGVLRVATTEGDAWATGGAESESYVSTLERDGDQLVELGRVGGMGEGEQIYAVRFLGDVGYVVTFEQTDPLYTLDLSDPADPRVVGELKIPGYSAYLHPIGDGLLLGVGQDATDEGRRLGAQVSLFDVRDPANPERIDTFDLGDGASEVEWDHHAFLWWADTDLAVLPTQSWGGEQEEAFSGVVGVTADASGLRTAGRLATATGGSGPSAPCPPDADCAIGVGYADPTSRSMVVDGSLWILGGGGLRQADLDTFEPGATVTF